jgi:hypothetical protein
MDGITQNDRDPRPRDSAPREVVAGPGSGCVVPRQNVGTVVLFTLAT